MKFTYDISDDVVTAVETQVEDLVADLGREVGARIAILLQKAREAALIKTAGSIDVPALVIAAGMKPLKPK